MTAVTRRAVALLTLLSTVTIPVPVAAQIIEEYGTTFVVNTTADGPGECPSVEALCTLREAIETANANGNPEIADRIVFDIPPQEGSPPFVIGLDSGVLITEPLAIHGFTQPGYPGDGEFPAVVVLEGGSGTGLGAQASVEIVGLEIRGFGGPGIGLFTNSDGSHIFGNWVHDNGNNGIQVTSSGAVIGEAGSTTVPGDDTFVTVDLGNRIDGNAGTGVSLGTAAIGSAVVGNVIGPGNGGGVRVSASGTTVGGLPVEGADPGNVIIANEGRGISIDSEATSVDVIGNIIGDIGLGNLGDAAVVVQQSASDVTIEFNRILDNSGAGVLVDVSSDSSAHLSQNEIDLNGGLGIDLLPTGVTTSPESGQIAPVVTDLGDGSIQAQVDGPTGVAGQEFRIEFFSVAECDPSGFGEGSTFVGSSTGIADESGDVAGSIEVSPGNYTATSTGPLGTSEFSNCLTVEAAEELPTVEFVAPSSTAAEGDNHTVDLVLHVPGGGTLEESIQFSLDFDSENSTADVSSEFPDIGFEFTPILGFLGGAPDGQTRSVTLSVFDDEIVEEPETAVLFISDISGPAAIGEKADHTITINDAVADARVSFAADSSATTEGDAHTVDLVLELGGEGEALAEPVTATIGIAGGSAIPGQDYGLESTQIEFPPGSADGATATLGVTVSSDDQVEPPETMLLGISDVAGGDSGDIDVHEVTVTDSGVLGGMLVTAETVLGCEIVIDAVVPEVGCGSTVFAPDFVLWEDLDPLSGLRPDDTDRPEGIGRGGISTISGAISSIGRGGISTISGAISSISGPISSIGRGGISAIGRGAISTISLAAISGPISSIGRGGISFIGNGAISSIPIINSSKGTWEERLAGTVYELVPLQSITLLDIFDNAPEALDHPTLGSLLLSDLDTSRSQVFALSVVAVTLGNLTLADIGITDPCCPSSSTLAQANASGADMEAISGAISSIAVGSVDLDTQPIGDITIGAIGRGGISTIYYELLFDCKGAGSGADLPDCDESLTLAEAQNQGLIRDGLTFLELYIALLQPFDFDWRDLDLFEVDVTAGPEIEYTVSYGLGSGATSATGIELSLPPGFHYVDGSSALDGSPVEDPVETDGVLTWTLPSTPGPHELTLVARVGVVPLGLHRVSAEVAVGDVFRSAADVAPVGVIEESASKSRTNPKRIDADGLWISYLTEPGEEEIFDFQVPTGTRGNVILSHLDEDFDLLYFEPLGSDPTDRTPSEFGPQTPTVDDEGRHTDPDQALDAVPADDLDLASIGRGSISSIGRGSISSISANRGTTDEEAGGTAGDGSEEERINAVRVAGYGDATSLLPYAKEVEHVAILDAVCLPRDIDLSGITTGTLPSLAGGTDTLILWNPSRAQAIHDATDRAALDTALSDLVAELGLLGNTAGVIPVDGDPDVVAAYAAWDANPCSASAANAVVAAINSLVDGLLVSAGVDPHQIESITLFGPDPEIPFARHPDLTDLANEIEYALALQPGSPGAGSFASATVLTDDPYAAPFSNYDRGVEHTLSVPDWGVGRVIETPAERVAHVEQFVAANGALNPETAAMDLDALVTGYDFLIDGADATADALDDAVGSDDTDRSLIGDTWSKSDIVNAFPGPEGIVMLGAHFDHANLVPADIGTAEVPPSGTYTATELADPLSGSLEARAVFSVGCHAGFNANVGDGGVVGDLDYAQTLLSKGAVFVGNTGFGYGCDGSVCLSEDLMTRFASRLDGTRLIGDALAEAKREFYGAQLVYGAFSEKAMVEATLYGFPFWQLTSSEPTGPGARPPAPPGEDLAFGHTPVSVDNGTYFTTDGESTALHHRPITPKSTRSFSGVVTGIAIDAVSSHDEPLADPVFARPIFDQSSDEPEISTPDVIFPTAFADTVTLGSGPDAVSYVSVATGQFFGEQGGQMRLFDTMSVRYLTGSGGPAPEILEARAQLSNSSITFTVVTEDDADEVIVLYKPAGFSSAEVSWISVEMTEGPAGVWTGGPVEFSGDQIDWFAQVVRDGRVGSWFDKGIGKLKKLTVPASLGPVAEGDPLSLTGFEFVDQGGSGPYTATVDWGDGTGVQTATVSPKPDSSAMLIEAIHRYRDDGLFPVKVCVSPLDGGTECGTANAEVANADPEFVGEPQVTPGFAFHLEVPFGDGGSDDTHFATVDWGDGSVDGFVPVDAARRLLVADHTYSDLGDRMIVVTLSDDDGGSTELTIDTGAPVLFEISGPSDPVEVGTEVALSALFIDPDGSGDYQAAWDFGDGSTASQTISAPNGSATVATTHPYTAAGVYRVSLSLTDPDGKSATRVFEFVVVYDPSAGFVTGGGWIISPPGAYAPDPALAGKANFGFVSRYQRGKTVPSGDTQFQFRAADLLFESTSYEWLVIARARAQFKGEGTINGAVAPDGLPFKFFIVGFDGDLNTSDDHETDEFRIKIWYEIAGSEVLVYDNQPGEAEDSDLATALGGGSVVIHAGRGGGR